MSSADRPSLRNRERRSSRPLWRVETLALAASLFFALACNVNLWTAAFTGRNPSDPGTWLFAACSFVAVVGLQFALLLLVLNRFTVKPLLALLFIATAFAVYYMRRYNVFLDPTMLRNVLRTDPKEAGELVGWSLLPSLVGLAGLPIAVLWWVRTRRQALLRAAGERLGMLVLALVLSLGAVWCDFQDLSALMRNQKALRYLVTPGNLIVSLISVVVGDTQTAARPKVAIGLDARLGPRWTAVAGAGNTASSANGAMPVAATAAQRPALVVFVVGETARAANWGLDGYARQTTPELAAMPDVINFPEATSCGTNTETSVPCLFSPWGRRHYDEARIRGSESLLNVLDHAGVSVQWRDNQSGCKGVCDGLPQMTMSSADDAALCDGERCLDEILLHGLDADLSAMKPGPHILVLHQLGNHGPSYFNRYPPAFKRFMPTCDTPDLRSCSREQIVNAYDNAIGYTDHVLADTLRLLKAHESTIDSALVYVSDHGESLGENHLFLHGMPYAIAPTEQTHVPMLMWLSPSYARRFGVDAACLRQRATQPVSQDNLFHTLLGLLDVRTALHEPAMDLSAACRH